MKYVVFIVGLLLSLFGYVVLLGAWIQMTTAPEPGYSSSAYASIMGLFGVVAIGMWSNHVLLRCKEVVEVSEK